MSFLKFFFPFTACFCIHTFSVCFKTFDGAKQLGKKKVKLTTVFMNSFFVLQVQNSKRFLLLLCILFSGARQIK